MIEPPKTSRTEEVALATVKGLLSELPVGGDLLSELADLFLNPADARKQRWMEAVSDALNIIEERFKVLPQSLEQNQAFISLLYQASATAIRNHRREKIEALQNGIISSLDIDRFPEDTSHLFLRYIDELTVSHLSLLARFHADSEKLPSIKSIADLHAAFNPELEHPLEAENFRLFVFDLDSRSLIARGDLEDLPQYVSTQNYIMMEQSQAKPIQLTGIGSLFLQFIADWKTR